MSEKLVRKYFIQGFAMVTAPGRVADCDIFFRSIGHSPSITGVDLYTKEHAYLGFVYPMNIAMETKRAMLKYIRSNPKKWVQVHGAVNRQGEANG